MNSLSIVVFALVVVAYVNAGLLAGPVVVAGPVGLGHGGIIGASAIAPAGIVTAAVAPRTVLATHGATIISPSASVVAATPLHNALGLGLGLGLGHGW